MATTSLLTKGAQIPISKICDECREAKPLSEFNRDRRKQDGLQCRSTYAPPRDYAGRDCPEPPTTPPDPEPERGHWLYGEWIDDDAREWEPEWED